MTGRAERDGERPSVPPKASPAVGAGQAAADPAGAVQPPKLKDDLRDPVHAGRLDQPHGLDGAVPPLEAPVKTYLPEGKLKS